MNEADWLTSTDPQAMLSFLRDSGKLSERKARLFAVTCCRLLPYGKDKRFHLSVDVAERYADREETKAALKRARQAVRSARHGLPAQDSGVRGEWSLYWLAEVAASENAFAGVIAEMHRLATEGILELPVGAEVSLCAALRCLIGSLPFRLPPPLAPSLLTWNDGLVQRLAEEAYNHPVMPAGTLDRLRLNVLADALEEAGADASLVAHLREAGPHWRGCWAVDFALGRE